MTGGLKIQVQDLWSWVCFPIMVRVFHLLLGRRACFPIMMPVFHLLLRKTGSFTKGDSQTQKLFYFTVAKTHTRGHNPHQAAYLSNFDNWYASRVCATLF